MFSLIEIQLFNPKQFALLFIVKLWLAEFGQNFPENFVRESERTDPDTMFVKAKVNNLQAWCIFFVCVSGNSRVEASYLEIDNFLFYFMMYQ